MKIIVCTRQIRQDNRMKPDRSGTEAALRLKKKTGACISFLCLGDDSAMTQIREAMAMGCDEGILLSHPAPETLDAAACASVLAAFLEDLDFDLLMTSCYAVDSDAIQSGLLLAGKLNLPSASYVEEIAPFSHDNGPAESDKPNALLVKRQFEYCTYKLRLPLPGLISALPKPNQPFYMTADGISRAYRTEVPVISVPKLLEQKGLTPAGQMVKIRIHDSFLKKPRERGRVLTAPTSEAVRAIMDMMIKNHILT